MAILPILAIAVISSGCSLPFFGGSDNADNTAAEATMTPSAATAAPTATPEATASPTPTPTVTATTAATCHLINDYGLDGKPEVASSGTYIRVQYWTDGQPERETFIPTSAAGGGRFLLTKPLKGHVWEFADCNDSDMMSDVQASIARRKAGGVNAAGYVPWEETDLFKPAVKPAN